MKLSDLLSQPSLKDFPFAAKTKLAPQGGKNVWLAIGLIAVFALLLIVLA